MSDIIYNIRLTKEQMKMIRDAVECFKLEYNYSMSEEEKEKFSILFEVLGIEYDYSD